MTASRTLNGSQTSVSHLFYMDDLKLFANSAESLSEQTKIVALVSRAIHMKLNVKKCVRVQCKPTRLQKEQAQRTDEPTPDSEAVYKYLGMEKKLGLKEAEAWDRVTAKSTQIVQKLWSSDLTFPQKLNTHNSTVIATLCYVVNCIIKGSGKYITVQKSGQELDQKVRYKSS